ncbi:inositol-phosphate phosphatase, partial [Candidatus Woesebacteria bacterium]|nr:inositol-phosphate phosphatase [Candidatus Woesebacteria bacterium]
DIISKAYPEHGFVGEEYGSDSNRKEYTWVIDPIDGTKNYSRGIPHFATELALFEGDELILGISNAPLLKKRVTAEKNKGAFLNETTQIHVSTISNLANAYISVGSIRYFDSRGKLETLSQLNKDIAGLKGFGDTWSYHFLAEGKLDAIIEAKTNLWDFAATAAIVTEAGGNVTDFNGEPISFSTETLIASNGLLHDSLVQRFHK